MKPIKKCFKDVFELSPSPNSFAWYQKSCKAFPQCVLGEIQWRTIETILRHFQILSQPNFCWNLINFSKTFSNCLLAQIHLHGTKKLQGISKMCLRQNSMASYWSFSKTFSDCFSAEIRLNPFEIILRRFRIAS